MGLEERISSSTAPGHRRARRRRSRAGSPGRCASSSAARWRPLGSYRYARPPVIPAPKLRPDRAQDDDRPAGHVLAAVRADALDDGLGAAVADGEAHPGPADEVEPARRSRRTGTVLPAIAWPTRLGGEIRLRGDRDRPARQALGRRSRSPGRSSRSSTPGPAKAPNDWPAAPRSSRRDRAGQLAALDRAGQPGAERAVGRGQAQAAGRDRALAAERGRDAGARAGEAGRVADVAAGRRRVRPTGRGAPATAPAPMTGASSASRAPAIGAQQPARLADDLADRPRADGGQLAPEVLGEGE